MYFFTSTGKVILEYLKSNSGYIVSLLVKMFTGLTGFAAWAASTVLKKLVEYGIITAEKAVDAAEDKKAIEELKKESAKPLTEIDRKKLDELERKILEGK